MRDVHVVGAEQREVDRPVGVRLRCELLQVSRVLDATATRSSRLHDECEREEAAARAEPSVAAARVRASCIGTLVATSTAEEHERARAPSARESPCGGHSEILEPEVEVRADHHREERCLGRDEHRHPPPRAWRAARRARATAATSAALMLPAAPSSASRPASAATSDAEDRGDRRTSRPSARRTPRSGRARARSATANRAASARSRRLAVDRRRHGCSCPRSSTPPPLSSRAASSPVGVVPVRVRARHLRDDGEVVLGRRRGDRSTRASARATGRVPHGGPRRYETTRFAEEQQDADERDEAADRLERRCSRPADAARIRVDAARHPEQADDVHREEEQVRPDEDDPER